MPRWIAVVKQLPRLYCEDVNRYTDTKALVIVATCSGRIEWTS